MGTLDDIVDNFIDEGDFDIEDLKDQIKSEKSAQVPLHPSHRYREDRSSHSDGQSILDDALDD